MTRISSLRLVLALTMAACSAKRPVPITAGDVSGSRNDDALVDYLAQRDASPSVCDLSAASPHLAHYDAGDLVNALRERNITPTLWRDCVERLALSVESEKRFELLDQVVRSYSETIADPRVEYLPVTQAQVAAMQTLLADRPGGIRSHTREAQDLITHLHDLLDKRELGPIAERFANEMIVADQLGQGVRNGQAVTDVALDALFQARDTATLRLAALRLPDPALRDHAQRLGIRLKIQASPYQAVQRNASAVEETVMRLGMNPVSVAEHRPVRAWIDSTFTVGRSIRIRQDLRRHTFTLLGDSAGAMVSVVPQLALRGALHVTLDGVDQPITLCGTREELEPSPCLALRDVSTASQLAHLESDGTLRFTESLDEREAIELASSARLDVPLRVGGTTPAALALNFAFETPADLVFDSRSRGGEGPDLQLHVEPLPTGRLAFTIVDGDAPYDAIIERAQVSRFHVSSRGADGSSGLDGAGGTDGAPGFPGSSASCPSFQGTNGGSGGSGGVGGNGSNGQSGGRGGNIILEVKRGDSPALVSVLRATIRSEGGAGGPGGSGGRGGRGGAGGPGGSGTTCVDAEGHVSSLSGGSTGSSGSDGQSGLDGSRGSNGRSGEVTVRMTP